MADNIQVTVAKSSGFCFGVDRAAKFVEKEIETAPEGERIYTLGHLIHNDTYNARLAARGVGVISADDIEDIALSATEASPVKVFVRAHGIERRTEKLLRDMSEKNSFFSFVDCTCVFVKKIHRIVEENNDERGTLLVLGSPEHPEVVGFCSRFDGDVFVFERCDQLKEALENGRLSSDCTKVPILVAQTTQKLGEWARYLSTPRGR